MTTDQILSRIGDIASAYLKRNTVRPSELEMLIKALHHSLSRVTPSSSSPPPLKREPAVSVKKSVTPDYLVCLEDGRRVKMLKRYLWTHYGMTPQQYRAKWELPFDYPMAAPNYTTARSERALATGFGRRKGSPRVEGG